MSGVQRWLAWPPQSYAWPDRNDTPIELGQLRIQTERVSRFTWQYRSTVRQSTDESYRVPMTAVCSKRLFFYARDAMRKRGLCSRPVSVRPYVRPSR